MNISDSRFMVETPFVGCDHSFLHGSLSAFGLGRGTHRPLRWLFPTQMSGTWCRLPGSNRRPAAYEAAALTNMS